MAREPIAEVERRSCESRATVDRSEGRRIVGFPIVFNSESRVMTHPRIGQFRERVLPEAVDHTMRSGASVKALWNHNSDLVLGNTRAGTLFLRKTATALRIEIDPPQWAEPQLETIQRGDVDGMSFAFRVLPDGEDWDLRSDGLPLRTISDMEFTEVSLTAFAAYEATSVSVSQRSLETFFHEQAIVTGRSIDWWQKWHRTQLAR